MFTMEEEDAVETMGLKLGEVISLECALRICAGVFFREELSEGFLGRQSFEQQKPKAVLPLNWKRLNKSTPSFTFMEHFYIGRRGHHGNNGI